MHCWLIDDQATAQVAAEDLQAVRDWKVVIWGRFSRKENIIRTEGRASVLVVMHALRAPRNLGARAS